MGVRSTSEHLKEQRDRRIEGGMGVVAGTAGTAVAVPLLREIRQNIFFS